MLALALAAALPVLGGCEDAAMPMDAAVGDGGIDAASPDLSASVGPNVRLPAPSATGDGGVAEAEPAVAVHGATVVAAYMARTDRVVVTTARSTDDGAHFLPTGLVPLLEGEQAFDPSVAFDSGGVSHVSYMVITAVGRALYETAFDPGASGGGAWRPRVAVRAEVPLLFDAPWIFAGPGDQRYVVHTEHDPSSLLDEGSVVLCHSVASGSWPQARLTVAPPPEVATGAIDGAGVIHIAYTDEAQGVWYVSSADAGVSLGTPLRIGTAVSSTRVGLAVGAAGVFITYFDARPGIVLQRRLAGSAAFDARFLTSGLLDFNVLHPQVALSSTGKLAVAFYAADDTIHGRWRSFVSTTSGASFAPGVDVGDTDLRVTTSRAWPDWLGDYEGLVPGADGSFYTVWTDNRAGDSHIFFARLKP